MNNQVDLAKKEHWDRLYKQESGTVISGWKPKFYNDLSLEYIILKEIDRYRPKTILEVGCGNSRWLPYLAKNRPLKVFGMEYSEEGCELARRMLAENNVEGTIFCRDLFKAQPEDLGQYDFVYSLGLAEHFADLKDILFHLAKFVKPGGVLLTEIPNLSSFHGCLVRVYQPGLLEKHRIISQKDLHDAHFELGLRKVRSTYVGLFSLGIVAWGMYQRFPRLDAVILPLIRKLSSACDKVLRNLGIFYGTRCFSPYIYAIGEKPQDGKSAGSNELIHL